jgi:type I restriction enzyme S subunit
LADIGIGEFLDRSQKFITADKFKELNCTELKEEDILISRMADPIGRACLLPQLNQKAITAVDVTILRTDRKLAVPMYIKYLCNTKFFIKKATAAATGTTRSRITRKNLEKIKIPLPTLSEQMRIVEILDQADALRRMRTEADAKAERILPALFIKMFGDPATNPMGWEEKNLSDLEIDFKYGTSVKCHSITKGLPVLRIPNILGGEINLDALKYGELSFEEMNRLLLQQGDLLFVRTNGNPDYVGRCAVFNLDEPYLFASYLIRARFSRDSVESRFIAAYLQTPSGRQGMLPFIRTTAGQSNISVEGLKNIPIFLPDIELQRNFVNQLDNLYKLRRQREKSKSILESIFQSLLSRAFSGELTAKWREAHMRELLVEMEQQAKTLDWRDNPDSQQLSLL